MNHYCLMQQTIDTLGTGTGPDTFAPNLRVPVIVVMKTEAVIAHGWKVYGKRFGSRLMEKGF